MGTITALLLAIAGLRSPLPADQGAYARQRLLVEPADLAKSIPGEALVVLDARKREDFEKDRVPAARWVDAAAWAKDFGKGDDAAGWGRRIAALGIGPRSRVVVYDDVHFKDAARVWWILRYWSVEDAALLNGGWTGWKAGGLPVETAAPKPAAPAEFAARPRAERLTTKEDLLDSLKG